MKKKKSSSTTKVKVFCLGLGKTGTASFREAMKMLGYENWSDSRDEFLGYIMGDNWEPIIEYVKKYDGFKAWPWALIYQKLDEEFPGSKFVLLERDKKKWIDSNVRHFGTEHTPMREWIFGYGYPSGHEDAYLDKYESHNKEVKKYFKGDGDLLVMDITNGDGWDKLCPFLGMDIPSEGFPHANKYKGKYRHLVK